MFIIPPLSVEDRPKGKFFSGFFSWVHPWHGCEYEEEWGRKWIDGFSFEFASRSPHYDKTGLTRKWEG